MANVGELDVSVLLDRANAGVPLRPAEIVRMVEASGVDIGRKSRAIRQEISDAEVKFLQQVQFIARDISPVSGPVPRRRLRRQV